MTKEFTFETPTELLTEILGQLPLLPAW